jgi:uncharacterized membrane protein YcaP (DUF421 family)
VTTSLHGNFIGRTDMELMHSWASIGRTALACAVAYVALVAILRVSGKRTLAKMNAFDMVVTIALGSTLASVITSDRLPLANGLLALALLVLLQYAVAWANVRSAAFRRLVKSEPTLLLYDGTLQDRALRQSRVAPDEVFAALRGAGIRRLGDAGAVVLESDGSFSVIAGERLSLTDSSLRNVRGAPEADDPTAAARG